MIAMASLSPCPSCACFVKDEDAVCPFCDAVIASRPVAPRAPRMSRAAWLAFGATAIAAAGVALVACSSGADPTGTTAGKQQGAPPDADADADADAGPARFQCFGDHDASAWCLTGLEFCSGFFVSGSCPSSAQCEPIDATPYTAACAATPTCDCIGPKLPPDNISQYGSDYYRCKDLPGSGVEVDEEGVGCGGCYGAPPARLERLRGAVG
jgi:hypothetical protein